MECRKVKYRSEDFAIAQIDRMNKQQKYKRVKFQSYLCHHCGCWHLSSKENKKDLIINELHRQINELNKKISEFNVYENTQALQVKKDKAVADLLLKIEGLEKQIANFNSADGKKLRLQVKKDEQVKNLKSLIESQRSRIKKLEADKNTLIAKCLKLESKNGL